jgi:hypothetical protein
VDNSTTLVIIVALLVAAVMTIGIILSRRHAKERTAELQHRFGPEYDRALMEHGTRASAERELAARARRVERFQSRELGVAERERFATAWTRIQAQFVDDPALAVSGAGELINQVMRARGFPTDDFEQRVADLTVEHPDVVQHYRAAQSLFESNRRGQSNTEELRQAVVHYRFLFADLLQPPMPLSRGRSLSSATA